MSCVHLEVNTAAQILVQEKEVFMLSGILFSIVISILTKILKRGSPGLLVERVSPDREDKTHSASGVELKFKYSGWTSQKTPSALVLTANMQHRKRRSVSTQRINDNLRAAQ
jgi:hypothetical protein